MLVLQQHSQYLKRCFELARLGETLCFPNPMVGCVIVQEGNIIAEGFHREFGEAHAEVNAISQIPEALDFSKMTIYVSLEPCAHYGKTPPCSDLIIEKGFKELVYACSDPNPQVAGKGIKRIKDAGIKVLGPEDLEPKITVEAKYINRVFLNSFQDDCLPWLTAKIALTEDGKMIPEQGMPKQITNEESRRQVHRLRSTHQLLITSTKTIIEDNPEYNLRFSAKELKLADTKTPDIVIVSKKGDWSSLGDIAELNVFNSPDRKVFTHQVTGNLKDFLREMKAMGYKKIMIEAGPSLTEAFKKEDLINELIVHQAQNGSDDIRHNTSFHLVPRL